MQIGSYQTKRGKRYRLELKTGKTIRGLTESEVYEMMNGFVSRHMAKEV